MKPKILTVTGNTSSTDTSGVLVLDYHRNPFNVGIGVVTDGSSTGYKIQHTFDPDWGTKDFESDTSITWFDHPDHTSALTANDDLNYAFPVSAIRILTDTGGTDTITAYIVQAGIRYS